jgi:structural maintenance of chromosome 4
VFNHTKPSGGIGKISLKRVVYHTSVSKYYLNDHEVALDTVMTFFKERGLNIKHSRFLVLQGEVEEIFSMKPKSGSRESPGLLEFLEGTVGTAEFRDEMEETDEKLTRLDDRRIEDGERSRLARSAVE